MKACWAAKLGTFCGPADWGLGTGPPLPYICRKRKRSHSKRVLILNSEPHTFGIPELGMFCPLGTLFIPCELFCPIPKLRSATLTGSDALLGACGDAKFALCPFARPEAGSGGGAAFPYDLESGFSCWITAWAFLWSRLSWLAITGASACWRWG